MKINILTLFPEYFDQTLKTSMLFKAQKIRALKIKIYNLRDFGIGPRKQVDDRPYGGGAGMILRVDVMSKALAKIKKENKNTRLILLTPKGRKFDQKEAKRLSKIENLTLICGHYEGFDERIRDLIDEEISIGDYILTGGEPAALVVVDAIVRLVPGVLKKEEAPEEESFSLKDDKGKPLFEYAHYTRPEIFKDRSVPKILLKGNHQKIKEWREERAIEETKKRI